MKFALTDVLSSGTSESSFDGHLRARLSQQPSVNHNNVNKGKYDTSTSNEGTLSFDKVRYLFQVAAQALSSELNYQRQQDVNAATSHCHWVPGRIEVMGKHTDYAGGNSLVCATAERGMAMVSTFIQNNEHHDNDDGMKVTIVSVLPKGMEHHAKETTCASYEVDGRPVVHHTIHIPNNDNEDESSIQEDSGDAKTVDWTIYPTAVIHRLHQNFGLFPHYSEEDTDGTSQNRSACGGHIFIALSSNLPPASGLSTSSAFVTGLYLVLNSHLNLSDTAAYRNAIGEDSDENAIYNLSTYLGNCENGGDYIHNGHILRGTVKGGVGTFGGSEDHAAILTGKSGTMSSLSFCPTRPACVDMSSVIKNLIALDVLERNIDISSTMENIPNHDSVVQLSNRLAFVIAYSGAKAEKAGGADGDNVASIGYNSASELAQQASDAYFTGNNTKGHGRKQTLADAIRLERERIEVMGSSESVKECILRDIKSGALLTSKVDNPRREEYSTALAQRFEQFYDESECLVPAAAYAISKQRYDLLGPIVDASHRNAVNLLKNQIEETAWLPLWARGIENCLQLNPLSVSKADSQQVNVQPTRIKALAASAFGAGFGGSCK